jgi:hypothetical protein
MPPCSISESTVIVGAAAAAADVAALGPFLAFRSTFLSNFLDGIVNKNADLKVYM